MWRFKPIFKTKIWGGDKILAFKGWKTQSADIGESWEISDVPGNESLVASPRDFGLSVTDLIAKYGASLVGEKNYERFGDKFPLLIKFIDASSDLSVQVHPGEDDAVRLGCGSGKTEMWYVLEAAENASLISGFKEKQSREKIIRCLETDSIEEVLRKIPVKAGDSFFIPSGRVHAIGAGIMLLEIQQTSDSTFRLYDYRRKDKDGRERRLDIDLALEVLDYEDVGGESLQTSVIEHVPSVLIDTPAFTSKVLTLSDWMLRNYSEVDSFVVMVCVQGYARLVTRDHEMEIHQGETVLLSALEKEVEITPGKEGFTGVEVFIR